MAGAGQQKALGELEVGAAQQEAPKEMEVRGPSRRLPRSWRGPRARRLRMGVTSHKSPTS
jgi:hypothetical protein